MLRKEQNDLLTQTGPGTPFGQMFRCYWVPALLAEELPENECPPVRVKLFSERLLAFRDSFIADCGAWNPIGAGIAYNTAAKSRPAAWAVRVDSSRAAAKRDPHPCPSAGRR